MKRIDPTESETHQDVRAQLQRVLAHPSFSNTRRLSSLLRHVVEQTLAGRAGELKEYTLGVEVLNRGMGFDPRLDSIVRVEASKLRARLAAYYQDSGANDPVVIELARGSYVPVLTRRGPPMARQHAPGSIAVLPFVNLSLDADGEYFADGLTEEVINSLGSVASPRVVSRTSSFQFKGKTGNVQDFGARLGANYLIEGSVRKLGEQLRVTARLIEVRSGFQLWSQAYDGKLTEVFAIEKSIALAICAALGKSLKARLPAHSGDGKPASMEAHDAYLRARFHRNQWTLDGVVKSIDYFQKALACEPDYGQALAGLSEAYTLRAVLGDVAPGPYIELARVAAQRAQALSPDSAQAHVSLAWIYYVYDWQWQAGDAEISRATALEPSFAEAYHLNGIVLGLRGRLREASQSLVTALQLDPLSLLYNAHAALIPYFSRDFISAETRLQSALAMDRNFAEAHWMLGWVYEQQKKYDQALSELETAIQLSGENPVILGDKACVLALLDDGLAARQLVDQLTASGRSPHPAATAIARIHFLLQDHDECNTWLEKAFEARDTMLPWVCGDSRYEGLWAMPALQSFRRRMLSSAAVSG